MNQTQRVIVNLAITSMFAVALPVIAAAPIEATQPQADLKSIDINQDGNISKEEYMVLGGTEDTFKQSDLNDDKKLDNEELKNALPTPDAMKPKLP